MESAAPAMTEDYSPFKGKLGKKSDTERAGLAPSPLAPLPVGGEGKVNIKFNSLAPAGGEGYPKRRRSRRAVRGSFESFHTFRGCGDVVWRNMALESRR